MEQNAIERLTAKSAEEAIIDQISRDFNLAPFMARTQFQQTRLLRTVPGSASGYRTNDFSLTYVTDADSVEAVVDRSRAIYRYWLQVLNYSNLMSVISELGANICQRSGDIRGGILMQKIQSGSRSRVEVRPAVSNLG